MSVLWPIAVIAILAALLLPSLAKAKEKGKQVACFNNMRQLALAARLYMDDYNGGLFHHHEGWVLDDGSQVDTLPSDLGGVAGGGMGNSQAEKPCVIFFQPYLNSRPVGYCPSDRTLRSRLLAADLNGYNGNLSSASQAPPSNSELAIALREHLTIESYLLNSIFTHKSARYALEGVLHGFATDAAINESKYHHVLGAQLGGAECARQHGLRQRQSGRLRYLGWRSRLGAVERGQVWRSGLDSLRSAWQGRKLHLHGRACRTPAVEQSTVRSVSRS